MLVTIANYFEADRISVVAGEAMDQGSVVNLADLSGVRKVMKVDNVSDFVPGMTGVAIKYSMDARAVDSSSVPASWGSRIETIALGDDIVFVTEGAYLEYDASILDLSLDPARGGTLPAVGDRLGVKAAKFSTLAASSALATSTIARVMAVAGTKITIKLTFPQVNAA